MEGLIVVIHQVAAITYHVDTIVFFWVIHQVTLTVHSYHCLLSDMIIDCQSSWWLLETQSHHIDFDNRLWDEPLLITCLSPKGLKIVSN